MLFGGQVWWEVYGVHPGHHLLVPAHGHPLFLGTGRRAVAVEKVLRVGGKVRCSTRARLWASSIKPRSEFMIAAVVQVDVT